MLRPFLYFVLIFCLLFSKTAQLNGQVPTKQDSLAMYQLVDLVVKRLELMPEVAAVKKLRSLPVLDSARENEVIRQFQEEARSVGLQPEPARSFMQWQIYLGRKIQEELLVSWANGKDFPGVKKELSQIRIELDSIGHQMILYMKTIVPFLGAGYFTSLPKANLGGSLKQMIKNDSDLEELFLRLRLLRMNQATK